MEEQKGGIRNEGAPLSPGDQELQRVQKCAKEVQEVLRKYNCTIDFSMTLSRMGMTPHMKIVPKLPFNPKEAGGGNEPAGNIG